MLLSYWSPDSVVSIITHKMQNQNGLCAAPCLQLDVGNIELLQRKQVVRELVHRMGPRQLLLKDKLTFVLGSTCLWCAD